MTTNHILGTKRLLTLQILILICCTGLLANENIFRQARTLQHDGKFDEAIETYKIFLSRPITDDVPTVQQVTMYSDGLVQLMNTFQSKGEPEACITTLQEVLKTSSAIQKYCLRDYYSVMGYALSRTEKMKEAEETMMKVFTIPLNHATPERYFRDYAYAAAVFYSNPDYQTEVINWCKEALVQAQLCQNTSGKQWVTAMLGSIYKRNGHLNNALDLFHQSLEEAKLNDDDLGVLNSLHKLIDLFLYWDIPEYANLYATEAIKVEKNITIKNPMVSAQAYINKGRALHQMGETDSVSFYTQQARKFCHSLPYNSGMVDVELLHGTFLTELGGDSIHSGIQELIHVTQEGTAVNRAKAYHQLAQTYLKEEKDRMAAIMLDSLYSLVFHNDSPAYIHIDYEPIINHYLKAKKQDKIEQYIRIMLKEQQSFNEKRLNFNLVETIVDLQTEQKRQELEIIKLEQTNQHLMFLVCIAVSVIVISIIVMLLVYQRKQHKMEMKQADEKLAILVKKLNEFNIEQENVAREINEFLNNRDKRQELETLTPFILKENGEIKFRQCFELLHPLFLHRLRERVPSVTPREELLSMLIALKLDNKRIAELMAIAPRSVLMLRHRYRQKIGMTTELSLENFIGEILGTRDSSNGD